MNVTVSSFKTDRDMIEWVGGCLIAQGGKSSKSAHGQCLYRNGEGRKCAVGWLIPDNKYQIDFEAYSTGTGHCGTTSATISQLANLGVLGSTHRKRLELLQSMQSIHDGGPREENRYIWGNYIRETFGRLIQSLATGL